MPSPHGAAQAGFPAPRLAPIPEKQRQRSREGRARSTGARAVAGLPGHSARPSPAGGLSPSPSPLPVPTLSSFGPGDHHRDPKGDFFNTPGEEEPLIFLLLLLLEQLRIPHGFGRRFIAFGCGPWNAEELGSAEFSLVLPVILDAEAFHTTRKKVWL